MPRKGTGPPLCPCRAGPGNRRNLAAGDRLGVFGIGGGKLTDSGWQTGPRSFHHAAKRQTHFRYWPKIKNCRQVKCSLLPRFIDRLSLVLPGDFPFPGRLGIEGSLLRKAPDPPRTGTVQKSDCPLPQAFVSPATAWIEGCHSRRDDYSKRLQRASVFRLRSSRRTLNAGIEIHRER